MEQEDEIPLLPSMTPEEIDAFYRKMKNTPLTPEEIEFYRNPGELVPLRQVISELEEILRKKDGAGQ